MAVVVYGISNCDTVKKARNWLDGHGIEYRFHDLRQDGIDTATIQHWLDTLGQSAVVNKRSTTWRQLSADQQADCESSVAACTAILLENPTLIKRPVLELDKTLHIGFKAEEYTNLFASRG